MQRKSKAHTPPYTRSVCSMHRYRMRERWASLAASAEFHEGIPTWPDGTIRKLLRITLPITQAAPKTGPTTVNAALSITFEDEATCVAALGYVVGNASSYHTRRKLGERTGRNQGSRRNNLPSERRATASTAIHCAERQRGPLSFPRRRERGSQPERRDTEASGQR